LWNALERRDFPRFLFPRLGDIWALRGKDASQREQPEPEDKEEGDLVYADWGVGSKKEIPG
jgi:hypothetical protein